MAINTSNGCPYKGLQPYSEDDREYFFGRERDTEVIASNLYIAPLTILYGTSGVGKSSVLQAGVIPQLRENRRVIVLLFKNWQGENFHAALKETVLHAICVSTGKTADEVLREISKEMGAKEVSRLDRLPLDELVTGCAIVYRRRLLIIFDQFEEYFLYHAATTGAEGFDAEFARAVNQPESGVNFMISMREEELSKLDRFRPRIANLLSNLLRLENLDREAANDAIRKPLVIYNQRHPADRMSIEEDLIAEIIQQVRPDYVRHAAAGAASTATETTTILPAVDRIETPFLQLVLMSLWEAEKENRSRVLRLHTFNELGGALEIARGYLDKVMEHVTESQRATAAAVLRFLVTPTGSKIALDAASLASFANKREDDVLAVLDLLGSGKEMRILRKVTARNHADRYELFHDVLGPAILDWRSRYVQDQQRVQVKKEFSERQKRLLQAVAVLALLLLVMAGTTVYAFRQRSEALQQKRIADEALKALEDQKKRAEKARDESDYHRALAVVAREQSDKQRQIAETREREALQAKKLEAASRQKAESETKRANQQTALAENLVKTSVFNLKGFDAARLGSTDESIANFEQALAVSREQKNAAGEAYALINIADGYGTRGGVIPIELFTLFDNYEGTDYDDLMTDNYQVQSYGTNLQRMIRERKDALLADQAKAIESYQAAVDANRRQSERDLKKEAWIKQRTGDVQLTSQIVGLMFKERSTPDLSAVINSYNGASDSYSHAGLPFEEGLIQTRIAFLWRIGDSKLDHLQNTVSAYKRAREAFHSAGLPTREAATLIRLGETYKEANFSRPEYLKSAIFYYAAGAKLYGELGEYQKEGENYLTSGVLSANLDKNQAFDYFAKAMTALQRAERALPAADNKEAPQIENQRELLRSRITALIRDIADLYQQDPKPRADLNQYFNGLISIYASNHRRRASILDAIAEVYRVNLNDYRTSIDYYRAESDAWKDAHNTARQAEVLVTIGSIYNSLRDRTNARASFEETRMIYRGLTDKIENRDLDIAMSNLSKIAHVYMEWGENKLAFETFDQAFNLVGVQDKPSSIYGFDEMVQSAMRLLTETEAPRFFERLTTFYQTRGDVQGQASILERGAELYAGWGKRREAVNFYNRALILRPTPGASLAKIGRLYYDLYDPAGAKIFFNKVVESYRRGNDSYGEAYALSNIGAFYRALDNTTEAINFYSGAVESFCRHKNSGGVTNALRALGDIYLRRGDTKEAARLASLADDPKVVSNCDFKIKPMP